MMSGLSNYFDIELAISNVLLNTFFVALAFFLGRKHLGIGSLLFPLSSTLSINLGGQIIPHFNHIGEFLCGILFLSFSIAIASKLNCGKNPYDAFCFSLMDIFNKTYNIVRIGIDITLLIIGIALGGTFGVGTIINAFVLGNSTYLIMRLLDNWIWFNNFIYIQKKN